MSCFFRFMLFALAVPAALDAHAEVIDIDTAKVAQLTASGVTLIDIRTEQEWRETGVAPQSLLITYSDRSGNIEPDWLEKIQAVAVADKPLILICRSGGRSERAARLLDGQNRYKTIYNALGGMNGWIAAGYPTAKYPDEMKTPQ